MLTKNAKKKINKIIKRDVPIQFVRTVLDDIFAPFPTMTGPSRTIDVAKIKPLGGALGSSLPKI